MKLTFKFTIVAVAAASILSSACKDDDNQTTPSKPAACRVIKEYKTGTLDYTAYEYEGDLPKKIVGYNEVEIPETTLEVLALEVRKTSNPSGFRTVLSTHYESDYLRVSPSSASISITYDNITTTDANTFLYRYDNKGRMVEVIQQTPNVTADNEYILTISYDDNDNVIRLRYDPFTGLREEITIIDVSGYDNNPTPYAGVTGWKYLMSNFTWNNHDPLPVILALTKNNPGTYHLFYKGDEKFSASFTYEYNDDGFPVRRDHVNKNETSESRFSTAYEYECK